VHFTQLLIHKLHRKCGEPGSVTLCVLLSCLGCDAIYTSAPGDPGSMDVFVQYSQPDTMLNVCRIANFLCCGSSKKCPVR